MRKITMSDVMKKSKKSKKSVQVQAAYPLYKKIGLVIIGLVGAGGAAFGYSRWGNKQG